MPKWATNERQAQTLDLWAKYGNRCLLGHTACDDFQHYVYHRPKPLFGIKPKPIKCVDRYGNPILDTNGQPLWTVEYKAIPHWVTNPEVIRLYDLKLAEVIGDWIAEDKQAKAYERKAISRLLHTIPEVGALRGQFNAISRDIYHESQPIYFIECLGISGLTFNPFAKVRIASSYTRLLVDLKAPLTSVSKNRKRKFIRYGKGLPIEVQKDVELTCNRAIAHYLS
jgi:hypothetical protein